jgi:hypothetical protein
MIAGNAATAKRSNGNSGEGNWAFSIGFASGAGEGEWRLCHSPDAVTVRKLSDWGAGVWAWLAIVAAVPRVGAEQIEVEVVRVVGVAARAEHRVELGASPGKGSL